MSPGPRPCSCSLVVMGASQDPRGRVVVRLCPFKPCACARSDGYEKKTTSDSRQPLLPVGNVLGRSSLIDQILPCPQVEIEEIIFAWPTPEAAGRGPQPPLLRAARSLADRPRWGNRQQGLCRHRSV